MAPGRYACPACGVTNEVRGGGGGPGPGPRPQDMAPPAPPPEVPSRRARCPDAECGFSFIVGDVSVAPCPMCGAEVVIGGGA
ncbi:MAG: hypothetical protein F4X18_07065 [Acidimicrobiia bacterium]|nr:hypothetical protein [Acidimicrobiia bacterium]MYB45808.1 hypothetical protein [Acidimicrobiia bacterium]MYC85268.1 hypothetical protein [Acidimicrobiia bacterium]